MEEEVGKARLVVRRGRKYNIALDSLKGVPMHHANHVMFSVSGSEVGLTFSVKLDSLLDDNEGEDGTLMPQVCCFMTISQSERFANALVSYITDYKEEKRRLAEQKRQARENEEAVNVE